MNKISKATKKGISMEVVSAAMFGMVGVWSVFLSNYGIGFISSSMICNYAYIIISAGYIFYKDKSMFLFNRKHALIFGVQGVIVANVFKLSYFYAFELLPVGIVGVIIFCMVFPLMLFSRVFFKEKISIRKIISAGVAGIGVCLTLNIFAETGDYSLLGILMISVATLFLVIQSLISNYLIQDGVDATTGLFYISIISQIVLTILFPGTQLLGDVNLSLNLFGVIIMFSLFNAIPQILMVNGLKYITPSQLGICHAFDPVVAILAGVLILGEVFSSIQLVGMILIIGSVLYMTLEPADSYSEKAILEPESQ